MSLPDGLPIVDHHCHLSPNGEGVGAARRFAAAGGTHLFLATQQYEPQPPRYLDDYRTQFEKTEALARKIGSETGLVVYPVIAPYPVDLVGQVEALGAEAAQALHERALDLAGRWIEERRAVALGEVGRPHFAVSPTVGAVVDGVFRHALEVARDVGAPAVVHCEDLTPSTFAQLGEFAARISFPPGRLVKHYARTVVDEVGLHGVVPSYLARRETVTEALEARAPWMLETDFLDDPRRPGAVLDLATVPRRAAAVAQRGTAAADRLFIPFVEAIERVYGFRPVAPARRGS